MFNPRNPHRAGGATRASPGTVPIRTLLPLARDALHELASSVGRTSQLLSTSRRVVLLVDDCPIQQLLGCAMLSHWGIMPQLASNGVEAIRWASEQSFDLILMDVDMPLMDGLVAASEIRRQEREQHSDKRVPLIAYTAGRLADNPNRWRECGMDGVLAKPCQLEQVGACLDRWCPQPAESRRH